MRVLIIGGTRFVGYQLTWRLVAAGHHVTLLNRGSLPDPFRQRVERLVADRTTPDFQRVLSGRTFDAAVDFASYSSADAQGAIETLGSSRVGHYIHVSTGQVYLVREGCPSPARETDYDGPIRPKPLAPDDLDQWTYGIGKRDAEDLLVQAWENVGFPSTRLRLPMINGERDPYRRVESYLWRILDGGPLILPDGGMHATRHVYSGSVVGAILGILGNPATFGQVYNLAQVETPTLADLLTLLAELMGARARFVPIPSSVIELVGLDPEVLSPFSGRWMSFLDPSKALLELEFRHESLERYLEKVVNVFLNAPPAAPPVSYAHRAAEIALADDD